MNEKVNTSHFGDKEALSHVIEKRAEGIAAFSEAHGMEIPGHFSAGADACREIGLVILLAWAFAWNFQLPQSLTISLIIFFGLGMILWKTGRSGWLAWSRLERLHRIIEQEKFEITHHREQEREELKALYRAKGLEGKLLEDVMDVLMADGDRLLKVMLEEELGLTLENHEHPLKQALGAGIGASFGFLIVLLAYFLPFSWGLPSIAFFIIAFGAAISAKYEGNRVISAVVWNLSIAALSFGLVYFLNQFNRL